jgi:hypothetical protein
MSNLCVAERVGLTDPDPCHFAPDGVWTGVGTHHRGRYSHARALMIYRLVLINGKIHIK